MLDLPKCLESLGTKTLVKSLVDHVAADQLLDSSAEHIAEIRRRMETLRARDAVVIYDEVPDFAAAVDEIRQDILRDLLPVNSHGTATLLRDLVGMAEDVTGKAEDCDGCLVPVFQDVVLDWGRAWADIEDRNFESLAGLVLAEMADDPTGVKSGMVAAFGPALGAAGLRRLQEMVEFRLAEPAIGNSDEGACGLEHQMLLGILGEVADEQVRNSTVGSRPPVGEGQGRRVEARPA